MCGRGRKWGSRGAPLLRASCGRERRTWEAMLLRKEQAAMAAPPGGRSRPPLPRPPPNLSVPPAQGRAGPYHSQDGGWEGEEEPIGPHFARRRCAEAEGCPTVQGRGESGEASPSGRRVSPEPGGRSGGSLPLRLRRWRGGLSGIAGPVAPEGRHEHVLRLQGEGGGR